MIYLQIILALINKMKEKELKEKIIAVLKEQGFKINPHVRPAICDKQAYKDVQQRSRLEQIAAHRDFLLALSR